MKMAQDQREILFGEPAPVVDHRAGGQGLYPGSEAVACRAEFRIGGVIENGHGIP